MPDLAVQTTHVWLLTPGADRFQTLGLQRRRRRSRAGRSRDQRVPTLMHQRDVAVRQTTPHRRSRRVPPAPSPASPQPRDPQVPSRPTRQASLVRRRGPCGPRCSRARRRHRRRVRRSAPPPALTAESPPRRAPSTRRRCDFPLPRAHGRGDQRESPLTRLRCDATSAQTRGRRCGTSGEARSVGSESMHGVHRVASISTATRRGPGRVSHAPMSRPAAAVGLVVLKASPRTYPLHEPHLP